MMLQPVRQPIRSQPLHRCSVQLLSAVRLISKSHSHCCPKAIMFTVSRQLMLPVIRLCCSNSLSPFTIRKPLRRQRLPRQQLQLLQLLPHFRLPKQRSPQQPLRPQYRKPRRQSALPINASCNCLQISISSLRTSICRFSPIPHTFSVSSCPCTSCSPTDTATHRIESGYGAFLLCFFGKRCD